jgi:hypothetical protein
MEVQSVAGACGTPVCDPAQFLARHRAESETGDPKALRVNADCVHQTISHF